MNHLIRRVALVAGLTLVSSAHVGSPDTWFEGPAGPYTVTVHIEAPPVVPGIAVVYARAGDSTIERVTAFVNTHDAEGGTPPPDELLPADDRPGWRRARLWVMNAGSNRVTVDVFGSHGKGSVVVPLAAIAQRRLAITPAFTVMVVAVAGILMAGMLTLVGAAVREGALDPGLLPDESRRHRARIAMARAAVVVLLVFAGTTWWWRTEDRAFRERLYRPLSISTRVDTASSGARFVLAITDSTWLHRDDVALLRARGEAPASGLIDDHGKLMHLFLVAEDGQSLAHLHPVSADTVTFTSSLPALPAGPYRVFADIVHQSGFTQTLTSGVVLPDALPTGALSDADDSWATGIVSGSTSATLADGTVLTWRRDEARPLRVGEEAGLRFRVQPPPGDSAALEPYLGMPGHAAVVRDDGQVFIHLHPMGTISPAAQARLTPPSSDSQAHAAMSDEAMPEALGFPYAFPEAGRYTVWVQVKRKGRILTGAFRADVERPQ